MMSSSKSAQLLHLNGLRAIYGNGVHFSIEKRDIVKGDGDRDNLVTSMGKIAKVKRDCLLPFT
jgi:hypothetical protein